MKTNGTRLKYERYNEEPDRVLPAKPRLNQVRGMCLHGPPQAGPQDYKGLIRLSSVPYGKIYATLRGLDSKGRVKTEDQRPRIFIAVDPRVPLNTSLARSKKNTTSLEEKTKRVLPYLETIYKQSCEKLER